MYDPSEIDKNAVSDTEHTLDVSIATYKICRELPEFCAEFISNSLCRKVSFRPFCVLRSEGYSHPARKS